MDCLRTLVLKDLQQALTCDFCSKLIPLVLPSGSSMSYVQNIGQPLKKKKLTYGAVSIGFGFTTV